MQTTQITTPLQTDTNQLKEKIGDMIEQVQNGDEIDSTAMLFALSETVELIERIIDPNRN